MQTTNELYLDGKIQKLGLSNYHSSEVQRAFTLCKEHNLLKPTCYQGIYNPLNRLVEAELLPILKANDCAFVAYNPLAAGLLTGKHRNSNNSKAEVKSGRFKNNPNYLPRFYTDANFKAMTFIEDSLVGSKISLLEATYRWLLHHSVLGKFHVDDGLLIGASSIEQLNQNLTACNDHIKPLPENVVRAIEEAWEIVKEEGEPFSYWRSFSFDMPGRENLDHGASYDAKVGKEAPK